ncbi:hypothetical protein FGO68_gene2637 [Halteria grandinella]|uniref:Uncharacterized protein n=1 Tax=Halteria grandinella TaxID=5974 RepID=A0A8J8NXN1_HALGN|nr:hypothetical protein FGO68_gene2637 [Halteria grandinella]
MDQKLLEKIGELERENLRLREGLEKHGGDFKELLGEIERLRTQVRERQQHIDTMNSEMKALPSLIEAKTNAKMLEKAEREIERLRKQCEELENDRALRELKPQSNAPMPHQPPTPTPLTLSPTLLLSHSDALAILDEIRSILSLDTQDPVTLLDTIRKLEKVVKAVPRMESFITSISRQLGDTPIEQVMPRVSQLRGIEEGYNSLVLQLGGLLPQALQQQQLNTEQILIYLRESLNQEAYLQQQRVLSYLMQLFSASDFKSLLEQVNQKMLLYSDASTFVRQARQVLGLKEEGQCFSVVMGIVQWYANGGAEQQSAQ